MLDVKEYLNKNEEELKNFIDELEESDSYKEYAFLNDLADALIKVKKNRFS